MKETIEKIVNAWYRTDPDIDFEAVLAELLPQYVFVHDGDKWIITNEI